MASEYSFDLLSLFSSYLPQRAGELANQKLQWSVVRAIGRAFPVPEPTRVRSVVPMGHTLESEEDQQDNHGSLRYVPSLADISRLWYSKRSAGVVFRVNAHVLEAEVKGMGDGYGKRRKSLISVFV